MPATLSRVVRFFWLNVWFCSLALGIFAPSTALAGMNSAKVVLLTPGFSAITPDNQTYFYTDESRTMTFEDILALPRDAFTLEPLSKPRDIASYNAYWLRIDLRAEQPLNAAAELAFPTLKEVDFYLTQNNTLLEHYHTGINAPTSSRPTASSEFTFPISLPQEETVTLYIRVSTEGPLVLPLSILNPAEREQRDLRSHTLTAMFLGLIVALAIYNLLLYLNIKDITYLYYTLHLIFVSWFQLSMLGYTGLYLWGDHTPNFRNYEPSFMAALTLGMILIFGRRFLSIDTISPFLSTLLKRIAIASFVVAAIAPFVHTKIISTIVSFGFYGCTGLLIYVAVYAYKHGVGAARYFLVAWGILIVGAAIQILAYYNVLPFNFVTKQMILFASALEALMMSIALADRINLMRQEKSHIQQQALRSAEKTNAMKDQFLANISHELRTPMNGVLGAIELINQKNLSKEDQESLRIARLSSRRMLSLVNGLLSYTEINAEKQLINKRSFTVPTDLDGLLQHIEESRCNQDVGFEVKCLVPENQKFIGDLEKLRTIILQLSENALKFTQAGKITLTFDIKNDPALPFNMRKLVFTVNDTGIGISEDKQQDIFQAFNRVENGSDVKSSGLGIGLALSSRLVTLLNGSITLESEPGVGSTFKVGIPLEIVNDAGLTSPLEKLTYIRPNQEPFILIAEDNEVNQKILTALCRKIGYKAIVAVNGEAAIAVAKQMHPSLIFMDCQMPVVDGFEATEAIRALPGQVRNVPIIAVTANASSSDQQRCYDVGMNDHITKPITLKIIMDSLMQWLPENQYRGKLLETKKNSA